jgi:hypothetical protein
MFVRELTAKLRHTSKHDALCFRIKSLLLEESRELQNGSCERYSEVLDAMYKAKFKESFTGEQQQYTGK